jgi:hypothetical protein
MSGSNEKAQRANAGRNFHTFYKRNNSTIPGSIELARLRYFARGIHALSERALFEHMTPPKAAPAPASAVVIIIREDRRQRATRQRQVQVESMTRRASASCFAHSNLARAVHAALDCRRHLADANEPETRASFGRLVEAPVQAGRRLDWDEGAE